MKIHEVYACDAIMLPVKNFVFYTKYDTCSWLRRLAVVLMLLMHSKFENG